MLASFVSGFSAPFMAAAVVFAAMAAFWDLRTSRIPNWLTFPAIVLGVAANAAKSGLPGLWEGMVGTLVGAGLFIIPFVLGGMGAGDVKMLAAVGAIAGPQAAFRTFLYGAIVGGVMATALVLGKAYLFRGRAPGQAEGRRAEGTSGRPRLSEGLKQSFPYGLAVFVGTLLAYMLR